MKRLIFALFMLLVMSSCSVIDAQSSKMVADAEKTRVEARQIEKQAEQDELDRIQAREIEKLKAAYKAERMRATAGEVDTALQKWISFAGNVGVIVIIVVGISIAVGFKDFSAGMVAAKVKQADMQAGTLLPDPITGLFPLLVTKTERGRLTVYNANTKEVYYLDTHNNADREAIRGMGKMLCVYAQKFPGVSVKEPPAGKPEIIRNLLESK
jgi:hypothetical protein